MGIHFGLITGFLGIMQNTGCRQDHLISVTDGNFMEMTPGTFDLARRGLFTLQTSIFLIFPASAVVGRAVPDGLPGGWLPGHSHVVRVRSPLVRVRRVLLEENPA